MKILIFLLFSFFFVPLKSTAQSCEIYFPMKENSGIEMLTYNAKDKPTGKLKYEVIEVREAANNKVATVKSIYYDKKDEEQFNAAYEVTCDGENVYIDMKSYLNQQLGAYKDMDITVESEDYVLPSNLSVGEEIKDARVKALISNNGSHFSTLTLNSSSKKVTAQEMITVPAGSFDCYKIEGNMITVTETMGIPITIEFKNVEWYAKGAGLIRTESYNKNGKLIGYSVLGSRW